jgi:TolB protein
MRELSRAALLAVTLVVLGLAPAADATFPGARGPIVFQRFTDPRDDASSQLFRVGPRGGPARRLTAVAGGAFNPDYSPNGGHIAFERRFLNGSPDAIYTIGADGSHPVRLRSDCAGLQQCLGDDSAAWSPSGRRLVFERAFGPIIRDSATALHLIVAKADGSGEQTIRRFRSLEGGGKEPHDAQWSPNGRLIAVNILNITAKPKNASAIYVLEPDGSNLRRITPLRLNAGSPDWSPDGKRIVFNSSYEGQAAVEIYTVRPDGSGLRRLRREPRDNYSFEPVFSPDGRRVAFVRSVGGGIPHIWTMRRDGTHLRQVTDGPFPDVRPDWGAGR